MFFWGTTSAVRLYLILYFFSFFVNSYSRKILPNGKICAQRGEKTGFLTEPIYYVYHVYPVVIAEAETVEGQNRLIIIVLYLF